MRIRAYTPDALVISLGVDTYVGDPISKFGLDVPEYLKFGAQIALPWLRPNLLDLTSSFGLHPCRHGF